MSTTSQLECLKVSEQPRVNLKPSPFCGGGETQVHESHMPPRMSGPGDLISVEVRHWCWPMPGVLSRSNRSPQPRVRPRSGAERMPTMSHTFNLLFGLLSITTVAWGLSFTDQPELSVGLWLTFWAAFILPRTVVPIMIAVFLGLVVAAMSTGL